MKLISYNDPGSYKSECMTQKTLSVILERKSYGVFTPEQDNKTNVEPVHSYDAFHTRSNMSGVKGIIGMQVQHLSCRCLVVVLLWCKNTISLTRVPVKVKSLSSN